MKNSIKDIEEEIVDEFNMFDTWIDKYDYLIDLGKSLPKIDNIYKTQDNIITGCQSQVWLHAKKEDNKVVFTADSDAIMTKGIIAMLIRVLSGQKAENIINTNLDFIDKIGLNEQLSQTRANGLNSMIKEMKIYALAFKKNNDKRN